jgi:hypothetical protein
MMVWVAISSPVNRKWVFIEKNIYAEVLTIDWEGVPFPSIFNKYQISQNINILFNILNFLLLLKLIFSNTLEAMKKLFYNTKLKISCFHKKTPKNVNLKIVLELLIRI